MCPSNETARSRDMVRRVARSTAAMRCIKFSRATLSSSEAEDPPHRRPRVITMCTVHKVRQWSALSFPVAALPTFAGGRSSQDGTWMTPISFRIASRT